MFGLIAKLHHGHLTHADGNGDWVLTIFTALSFVSYMYMIYEYVYVDFLFSHFDL